MNNVIHPLHVSVGYIPSSRIGKDNAFVIDISKLTFIDFVFFLYTMEV